MTNLLTGTDIHNQTFTVHGFGPWKGYDTTQVDDFLDDVEASFTVLERELDRLRKEAGNGTEG